LHDRWETNGPMKVTIKVSYKVLDSRGRMRVCPTHIGACKMVPCIKTKNSNKKN